VRIKIKRLPGRGTKKIIKQIEEHCVRGTFAYPLAIKSGKGCYIQDIDGNWFLDFNSLVSSCNVGYSHPKIMSVLRKYSKVSPQKIAGQDFYSEEHAALAKELVKITPKKLAKVMLSNSGAEAVENAIKFAYRVKGPLAGVSCTRGFHGRTLGALSFTDSKAVQKKHFPEVNNELIKFCTEDNDSDIEQLEKLIKRESVPAFVIVECVQGEGGYRPASKQFIKRLRRVSLMHDFPLIIDEVQSGVGRTGKWWSFEHYDVVPDIMSSAKSLQVGATISSRKYAPKETGAVSSTWGGGHKIDLAIGLKTIQIIRKERLLKNAERMGKYLLKRVEELKEKHQKIVDAHGLGLMIGIEFSDAKVRNYIEKEAFKKGLLLLGCGFKSIRIAPPLIISKKEADIGMEIIEDILKKK